MSDHTTNFGLTVVASTSRLLTPVETTLRRVDEGADRLLESLSSRALRVLGRGTISLSTLLVVVVSDAMLANSSMIAMPAAAQEAEQVMCETGAGSAITFAFGLIALLLLVIAGYRGAMGLNNMGSQRSDKKRAGQDQIKGAGYSLGGVFALIAFPALLDQVGLATISCVEFAPF